VAYIYKKIIGKKPYYYLRVSKRDGSKLMTKDVAYLGNDLSKIRSKLSNLPDRYKKEIRKSYGLIDRYIYSNHYLEEAKEKKQKKNPYFDEKGLNNVEAIRLHFSKSFLRLDRKTIEEVYKSFLIDFAYNTTSIEGNTITLAEADKLINENLTPKNRTPREIFDLQNTQKAFFYLLDKKPKFDEDLAIKIHDMLMENIDKRRGYRKHDIRVVRSRFKATPYTYIKTDMNLLFKWYNKNKSNLHSLVLAGLFHQKLEKIHPFSDGNGRTGRMIMNYMLIKSGYPPIIIRKINRAMYLNALSSADKSGLSDIDSSYFQELVGYLAFELYASYWRCFVI